MIVATCNETKERFNFNYNHSKDCRKEFDFIFLDFSIAPGGWFPVAACKNALDYFKANNYLRTFND